MKLKLITLAAAALTLALAGCAPGRYTGGGNLVDEGGTTLGTFTLNNISGADCLNANSLPGQDGIADQFRGEARWRGVHGESFTCNITAGPAPGSGGTGPEGTGQYAGTITAVSGNLYGATTGTLCGILVYPDAKTVGLAAGNSYVALGTVEQGNISYHKENTKGMCSSTR
jgi:hypothetical protein